MFPINAKKCKSFFWHFRTEILRIPAFLFPAKKRRQLRFTAPRSSMSHKVQRTGLPHPGKVLDFFSCSGKSLNFVHKSWKIFGRFSRD